MDLSAAYDTVNHRLLLTELYGMTEDAEFAKLIGIMMSTYPTVLRRSQWEEKQMA